MEASAFLQTFILTDSVQTTDVWPFVISTIAA